MIAVGIRELKNRLSHYVRLVQSGESVLVTDRGAVVAELRAPGAGTRAEVDPLDARLAELARRGRATWAAPHDPELYEVRPRVVPDGAVEELISAERGER